MSLDEVFLKYQGGVENNSLINIIEPSTDTNDESEQPQIIRHSPYYDFNKLSSVLRNNQNSFSIFSSNIQSINAKFTELKIFIEMLNQLKYSFSAICVQESWLSENDTSQIQLEGYQCIPQGKSSSSEGGLIIYLNNKFNHINKMTLSKFKTWKGQFIEVKEGEHLTKPIIIGNIYKPPKDTLENYYELLTELEPIVKTLESNKNETIITGDFDIDLLKINEKHVFIEYFDLIISHSFYPKITLPTRLSNKHGTLIDNFFCKLTEATIDTISGILIKKFSDHQPYFILLNSIQLKTDTPKFIRINQQDQESINKFHHEVLNSIPLINLNENPKNDPNINNNILHNVIQNAKSIHMPQKIVKFNKYKHKKSKWITQGIIKSITFRDNLHKNLKMTDPVSPEYATMHTNQKKLTTIFFKKGI